MGDKMSKNQLKDKNPKVRIDAKTSELASTKVASSSTTSVMEKKDDKKVSKSEVIITIDDQKSVNNQKVEMNLEENKEQEFFDWPILSGFKDLKGERSRFQLSKNTLDKKQDLDVNKIIVGVAEASKREDKHISKEKRLDDKRLHKIADGREQINNQDSLDGNLSRLSQNTSSSSTEGNGMEGENQDSVASAHEGKPKLSRRARARANRANEQGDEQGVLHSVKDKEVNGQSSEVVQGAVPHSYPLDEISVESNLQLAKAESANLLDAGESKLSSSVSEQDLAKGMVSNTPASEGKGSFDKLGKQIGTAESKVMQSLSDSKEKSVIKNASKGFLVLFSEKTDEILSPLSFVAHNHVKMAMAIIQLAIPLLLTYFIVTNVTFIQSSITNAAVPVKIMLCLIFYVGCLCASIFIQVLGSGIKGMFIKAFIDAATIGQTKK